MKKILFILLLAIACTGCESKVSDNPENAMYGWEYIDKCVRYRTVTINEHEYLVFVGGSNHPTVIHSESCPCKNKKKK